MGKVQVETDIPQIVNYVATTVTVGNTTILEPGQPASVTNSGTPQNAILNFGIPSTTADFSGYRTAAAQDIIDATKQPKTLSTAITVNGVSKATVEDALNAINENTAIADTDLSNLTSTGEAKFDAKANTSLSNLADAGKIVGASLSVPSATHENLTWAASGTKFTMPADGYIYIYCGISTGNYISFHNTTKGYIVCFAPSGINSIQGLVPVGKNDEIEITYTVGYSPAYFQFIYAQGNVSEAS